MTNGDRIRNMSDEELTGFIVDLMLLECPVGENCKAWSCHDCLAEWLKEKVE